MNYPGNPSLSPDVQEKTRSTFEQTLHLVTQGRDQEALAGCEFILGLDPLFQPARKLQDRIRSPERPVKVDDLRSASAAPPAGSEPQDDLLDLQRMSLSLDSGEFDPLSEIDAEPHLDELGEDSGLVDLEDLEPLEDLEELDSIEDLGALDLEALPDLDDGAETSVPADVALPQAAQEPLALGEEPLALGEEPLALGEEPLTLGGEPAAPAAQPIGPIPGMPEAEPAPLELADEPALGFADEDDEGGQERIEELLAEGQEVFETGDYQGAIDVWSRIFLIDISNGPASQRIEEARKKKAELERQAEQIFHEGVHHIEANELEEAKDAFRRVLEVDEGHSLAREYLGELEAGRVPAVASRASEASDLEGLAADAAAAAAAEGGASPSLEAAVQRDRVVVVKKTDKRLVALAALVAVVVLGGGTYLFLNKDKLFPNTTEAPTPPPRRVDPIVRATALYEAGETEQALEMLRNLPTEDPSYEKARAQLDQWEAQIAAETAVDTGPSPELLERRNLLLTAARQAQKGGHFLRARKYFERAGKILPLDSEDLALKLNCDSVLRPLEDDIRKFRNREYTSILRGLWQLREKDIGNHDVNRLIADSYYNLALLDLQRGDARSAAEKMKDALEVDPDDEDLQRLRLFSETYSKQPQDMLYLIFVKHLPERDL